MKKYLSVFYLFVKGSFSKILPVFFLMGLSQILLFYNKLKSNFETPVGIEMIIDKSQIALIFLLAYIAVVALLGLTGSELSNQCGYTLRRLNISEKNTAFCQAAYNSLMLLLLVCVQGVILMIIGSIYTKFFADLEFIDKNFISNQIFFLACYRNNFLHSIFPLEDVLRLVRNIIFAFASGTTLSATVYLGRRKKFCFEFIILNIIIFTFFMADGWFLESEIISIAASIGLGGLAAGRVIKGDKAYER